MTVKSCEARAASVAHKLPWVQVLMRDGSTEVLTLAAVFRRAEEIAEITGEFPPQAMAIQRLLQAILYRALLPDGPVSAEQWREWWDDWASVVSRVEEYLERWRDRFNLLDPDHPFMQVATLDTGSGNRSGMEKFLPALGAFFNTRLGADAGVLDLAEAARWLVFTQAFDTSGIKTGALGDPRVKGGRGYPSGFPAFTGNLTLTVVEGNNLAETLLLNLAVPQAQECDSVFWERPPHTAAVDEKHGEPSGPADLMVWQNRRVRLFPNADATHIDDVIVAYGDLKTPYNAHVLEPMAPFKLSANLTSKRGEPTYWPSQVEPGRQVWRGFAAILTHAEGAPNNLQWLATVRDEGILPDDFRVRLRVVGVVYGPHDSTIVSYVDDRFDARLVALTDAVLQQVAVDAVPIAQRCIGMLTGLAADLATATGTNDEAARNAAAIAGYAALDLQYREWLGTLSDPEAENKNSVYSADWQRRVRRCLAEVGAELCRKAGQRALIGRIIDEKRYDTASAWNRFTYLIHRETPLASQQIDTVVPLPEASTKESDNE